MKAELVCEGMTTPCTPHIVHMSLLDKKWRYRGEGNANLVIALPEDRVILRLHKIPCDALITDEIEREETKRLCLEAQFCRDFMSLLLGSAYIIPPVVAQVPQEEIYQLHHLLTSERPKFRCHKKINVGCLNIYPDYTLLPERLTQKMPVESPLLLRTSSLMCWSRGGFTRRRRHASQHQSLEEISCLSTTITGVMNKKCVNSSCVLTSPVFLSSDLTPIPAVNWKVSSYCEPISLQHADPTYCVEIKPKRGWILGNERQLAKCTFCLHQHLKLLNGTVNCKSQYCPLDLFSGNEERMKKAIRNLLQTPQNNLKIFKDGNLVYSEDYSSNELDSVLLQWFDTLPLDRLVESFCELVYKALTTNLLGDVEYPFLDEKISNSINQDYLEPREPDHMRKMITCNPSSQMLPTNCVLDRILWIQKLQLTDTFTTHRLLKRYEGCGDYDYVTRLCEPGSRQLCLNLIERYLLSTSANDCSIMIAFQRLRDSESVPDKHMVEISDSQSRFVFNIGVSDLGPKPLSSIEKHRVRDTNIQAATIQLT